MSVPIDDGYAMPGEYAPHARCWMAWPPDDLAGAGRGDEGAGAVGRSGRAW